MNTHKSTIKNNARSLILFILVGLSNTLVDYAVFFLLYHWFSQYYLLAQVISYFCGMVNSYLLNRYWTFQKKSLPTKAEILKFVSVNALAFSVSFISLYVIRQNYNYNILVCKMIATGISLTVNYLGSKLWVFKEYVSI